jgi:hypothetical protein
MVFVVMQKQRWIMIPVLIVLASFLLRWSLISKGPYNVDTLRLAIAAQETLQTFQLSYLNGPGYPLAVIFGTIFVFLGKILGVEDPVIAVNFVSVVFGTLCVWAYYELIKRLIDQRSASFSAIMFSICPIFLGLSVYGMSQVVALYFGLQGMVYLVEHLRLGKYKPLILAVVMLGLMGASRIQDLVLMAIPLSVLYFCGRKAFSDRRPALGEQWMVLGLCAVGVGMIVAVFHLPYLFSQFKNNYTNQLRVFYDITWTTNFMGIFSSRLLWNVAFIIDSLTMLGFLISLVGLGTLARVRPYIAAFLGIWILVPLLFYGNLHSGINPRYMLLVLCPLVAGQGFLLAMVGNWGLWWQRSSVLIFTAIICVLMMSIYPVLSFRHQHEILPDFARWVARVVDPQARVIVADENLFMHYYGKIHTLSRPRHIDRLSQEELWNFKNKVDALLDQGIPVYITTASLFAYDKGGHFSSFFKKHYDGILVGKHLFEDWHLGDVSFQIFEADLYKIVKSQGDGHVKSDLSK